MGGLGSGRYGWSRTPKVEDFLRLEIRQLHLRVLKAGASLQWRWFRGGEPAGSIRVEFTGSHLVLLYGTKQRGQKWKDVRQMVWLSWTSCHYGGKRPWFICPLCGRRVGILIAAGIRFLCRQCYRLSYRSQSETKFDRRYRRVRKIRERLGEPIWLKPKGMHQVKFDRLHQRLAEAEERKGKAFVELVSRFFRNHKGNQPKCRVI